MVAFILTGATLAVYTSIVYTQQRWSRGLNELQAHDRQERQMQTAIEAMKTQLAKQAEQPTSGLIPKSPDTQIIVPIAPAGSGKPNQSPIPGTPVVSSGAVGY